MIIRYIAPLALLTLVGCNAATPTQPAAAAPAYVADCVFPGTNTAAPGWICDEPQPGIEVSAVGVAEKSAAGLAYMKDMAATNARGQLAEQFKVQVSKMVKQYLGTTGVGESETVDAAAETAVKSVSSASLVGSKIYKTRSAPDGRFYALVGLDMGQTQKAVEEALRTSMNNDRAMWQKFQGEKAFEELAQEIAAQKVQ